MSATETQACLFEVAPGPAMVKGESGGFVLMEDEVLSLIGICGREYNEAFHMGSEAKATKALELKEKLKVSLLEAGIELPKGHDFLW